MVTRGSLEGGALDRRRPLTVGSGASSSRIWPQENVQASFRGTEGGSGWTADVETQRAFKMFWNEEQKMCESELADQKYFVHFHGKFWVIYIYTYNYIMIWWVCLEVLSPPKNLDGFRSFRSDKPPAICRSDRYTNFEQFWHIAIWIPSKLGWPSSDSWACQGSR